MFIIVFMVHTTQYTVWMEMSLCRHYIFKIRIQVGHGSGTGSPGRCNVVRRHPFGPHSSGGTGFTGKAVMHLA